MDRRPCRILMPFFEADMPRAAPPFASPHSPATHLMSSRILQGGDCMPWKKRSCVRHTSTWISCCKNGPAAAKKRLQWNETLCAHSLKKGWASHFIIFCHFCVATQTPASYFFPPRDVSGLISSKSTMEMELWPKGDLIRFWVVDSVDSLMWFNLKFSSF